MFDLIMGAAIVGAFLTAGTVKGVIGLGLPAVNLGLLTAVFDLTTAMVLLMSTSFATHVWHAVHSIQVSVTV